MFTESFAEVYSFHLHQDFSINFTLLTLVELLLIDINWEQGWVSDRERDDYEEWMDLDTHLTAWLSQWREEERRREEKSKETEAELGNKLPWTCAEILGL